MRAPLPIRLWDGQMREPDLLLLGPDRLQQLARAGNRAQPEGADLVMEIVSPGAQNRERDLDVKRIFPSRVQAAEVDVDSPGCVISDFLAKLLASLSGLLSPSLTVTGFFVTPDPCFVELAAV